MERTVSFDSPGILSQTLGKSNVTPKKTRMVPERYVQNACGTDMKAVEAFRRNVKTIIDTARDATTIYGVALLLPDADDPITTGSKGRIHGAKTVRTPAINAIARKVILF